jgi:outer membrane protein assembly factor BamA
MITFKISPARFLATVILILISFNALGGENPVNRDLLVKIDSVKIQRNWRTREKIILRELEIIPGESVTIKQIETSISRIWNIGNFAKVYYRLDTLPDKRILLRITALDALTIMPNLGFKGNKKEFLATAGVSDNNFLGRNIDLDLAGSFGTNAHYFNINLGIPRQLLYRNMTLRGGFLYGEAQKYKVLDGEYVSGVAYLQRQLNLAVGNPWHTDYHYTFSPDISVGYFSHHTDSVLLDPGVKPNGDYRVDYMVVSLNESAGIINCIRHQQDGYKISVGLGYGIGLNKKSPGYLSLGISTLFYKLLNRIFQISVEYATGYTGSRLPSLIYYIGPDHVKGVLSGERSGQSFYALNTALNVTYINHDWIAVEQSIFNNIGNGTDSYLNLYKTSPLFSVGTKVRIMVPMVPWLGINIYYAYRGKKKHWYSTEL